MAAAAARADILTVHRDRALVPVSAYSRSAVIGGAERDGRSTAMRWQAYSAKGRQLSSRTSTST